MGIGFAAAKGLHAEGAIVAVHGRDGGRVDEAISAIGSSERLVGVTGDVAVPRDCESIIKTSIEKLNGLDCLVHNAGVGDLSYFEDVTQEHFDWVMNVNLRSAALLANAAVDELAKSKGSIIYTASGAGLMAGPTDSHVYAVSKGGLISLARAQAVELAPIGVRVNALCPGYIETPLIAAENEACDGQIYKFIEECVPMARIGTPEECVSTIVYLASSEAAYVSGAVILNDGGTEAVRSWGGRN